MTTTTTLKDLIWRAANVGDHVAAGKVANYLRFRVGMDYEAILEFVNKHHPIPRAQWDAMLYRCDEEGH